MRTLSLLLVVIVLLAFTIPALAHESRTTDDGVQIVFGWWSEPAFAGLPNGPEVYLSFASSGDNHGDDDHGHDDDDEHMEGADHSHEAGGPITGADLQVTVSFGDQSMTVALRPAWGQPGRYLADIMPMLPGDYTFRVFGTAGEVEIDETFSSADGRFSTVEPLSDVQFPVAAPTTLELLQLINSLQAQLDELRAQIAE
jgi:hypothetical protein